MLHIESYWKAQAHLINENVSTCPIGELAVEGVQVVVPEEVDIPLPRDSVEQMAVPASINGRDLSQGKP